MDTRVAEAVAAQQATRSTPGDGMGTGLLVTCVGSDCAYLALSQYCSCCLFG